MKIIFKICLSVMAALMLTACFGGKKAAPGTGRAALKLSFQKRSASAPALETLASLGISRLTLDIIPAHATSFTPAQVDFLASLQAATADKYTIDTLTDDETYEFRIMAYDSQGNYIYCGQASAQLQPSGVNVVEVTAYEFAGFTPIMGSFTAVTSDGVTISGSIDEEGVGHYTDSAGGAGVIYFAPARQAGVFNFFLISPGAGTSLSATGSGTFDSNVGAGSGMGVTPAGQTFTITVSAAYPDVSAQISAAKTALENEDISGAHAQFQQAFNANPSNKDAAFGVAMTEGILLVQDPAVVSVLNKWNIYAPTVSNVVYGAVTNAFEVYGANTPYCSADPANDAATAGLTKLTTSSASAPYTFSGPGSYSYFIVYTPPYSQITIDGVSASAGNMNGGNPFCRSGDLTGFGVGTAGDGMTVTLGGSSLQGSVFVIKAAAASSSVTIATTGNAKATAPSLSIKSFSRTPVVQAGGADPLSRLNAMLGKLPKYQPTMLEKTKRILASSIPSNAPSVSEMQGTIDNSIIPVVNDMVKKLNGIEGQGYTFTITPAMTGGAETTDSVLGDGEFYAFDALLNGLNAFLNIMTAYNLDVDYNIFDADPLSAINGPSGGLTSSLDPAKFFTLKATGAAKMNASLDNLKAAADKAKACYDYVYNEWGYQQVTYCAGQTVLKPTLTPAQSTFQWHGDFNQTNACNPYDYTVSDYNDAENMLAVAQMGLGGQITETTTVSNGMRTVTVSNGSKTVTTTNEPDNSRSGTATSKYDVTKFFTSPLDRSKLPKIGYDLPIDGALSQQYTEPVNSVVNGIPIRSEFYMTGPLPDRTLNGIVPDGYNNMTYLSQTTLLDPSYPSVGSTHQVTTDGVSLAIFRQTAVSFPTYTAIFRWVDPSTGKVTGADIFSLHTDGAPNSIQSIGPITWMQGSFWAAGNYNDAGGMPQAGVFRINTATSAAENQIPQGGQLQMAGLISDSNNLYLRIGIPSTSTFGLVKFAPSTTSTIAQMPLFIAADDATGMITTDGTNFYLGGYHDADFKKVGANGQILGSYNGPGGIYLNDGRFWSVDGDRLHAYIMP